MKKNQTFDEITKRYKKNFKEMMNKQCVDIEKIKQIEKDEEVTISMVGLRSKVIYYVLEPGRFYASSYR